MKLTLKEEKIKLKSLSYPPEHFSKVAMVFFSVYITQ